MDRYNNKNFKVYTVDELKILKEEVKAEFIYKVYMARSKSNDRKAITVAAKNAQLANSMINNEKWDVINEDFYLDQLTDKEGIIGEGVLPDQIYNRFKIK